jgi:protein CpxP
MMFHKHSTNNLAILMSVALALISLMYGSRSTEAQMPPTDAGNIPAEQPFMPPAPKVNGKPKTDANIVAEHIKQIHDQLHITASQEAEWNLVAQAMRDSVTMTEVVITPLSNKEMNAVDILQSREALAQAHLDGTRKITAAFKPLYEMLSPTQKKAADVAFRGPRPRISN